ncbi:peptidase inhibitor family I36 protein [Streptomyces sp. CC228A]|uniref:peptidase inhibitor family I36 protein n=1 Tax=Streptomyces sp. CC228A TaxID=2898186 RepID=UPI001F47FE3E|nr:peptidase inhibitor family I36 protein [Streptomyces sp. CC228A]
MRSSTMRATTRTVLAAVLLTAGALTLTPPPAGAAQPALGACGSGQLCLWPKEDFKGKRLTYELADTDIDSCVPLPAGTSAAAVANRTGRPVTTYQSATCGETGEFETYPGGGTWVPHSPYQVRAFKIWEN